MSELTDLEMCKCIAEIEGVKFTVAGGKIAADTFQVHELFSCAHMGFIFNPLTDDALCFRFCYKDGISVHYVDCPAGSGRAYFANKNSNSTNYCDTPNRAVCLAKLNIFSE